MCFHLTVWTVLFLIYVYLYKEPLSLVVQVIGCFVGKWTYSQSGESKIEHLIHDMHT